MSSSPGSWPAVCKPSKLTASGFRNALRDLAAAACQNTGIKCHLKAARGANVGDDTVALHLYRVAQERSQTPLNIPAPGIF